MKSIKFPKANKVIRIADDKTTQPMYIFTDGQTCVSEWELTDEDIAQIARTRKIQLIVRAEPVAHPAVGLFAGDVIPDILLP